MWKRCLVLAAFAAWPRGAAAEHAGSAAPVSDLTLARALDWALAENPELAAADAAIAAAEGEAITAGARPNPELEVAPGAVVSKTERGHDAGFHGELSIAQTIEYPGKRALRQAIAAGTVRQRRVALDGLRDQLAIQVRKAFAECVAAREIVRLREQQHEVAERFADAARVRARSGYGSDFEAVKSDAEVAASARAVRAARGELAAARVALFAAFGREPTAEVREVGALDELARVSLPGDPVASALERNPELRVSREDVAVAALGVDAARLAAKPDLTIAPSAEITADEQIFGLGLSLPLPVWDRNQGAMAAADAEARRTRASIAALEREVSARVRAALERLRAAQDQAALYTPELLDRLRSLFERAERGYGQSATTFLIYLDARKTYFDTLADHFESLAAVAAARAALEEAVGAPLDVTATGQGTRP